MPEIRKISYANTEFALIEDPNPAYNRIFFSGQSLDLNTLTPTWQKQFTMAVGGVAQYAGFNGANGTFFDDVWYNSNGREKYGPMHSMTRAYSTGYTDQFPKLDNSWHRLGYIQLQKGTISTFAKEDNFGPINRTFPQGAAPASTLYGAFDTYWHSLDFNNFPTTKAFKSPVTGFCHFTHPSEGFTCREDQGTATAGGPKSIGWFTYNSDITTGVNNTSNSSAIFANWNSSQPTHFNWEDTQFGIVYGMRVISPQTYRLTQTRNYNSGNTLGFSSTLTLNALKPFFIGVDEESRPYYVACNQISAGNEYTAYSFDPRSLTSTTVFSGLTRGSWLNYLHSYPSNVRRTSNASIFYTGHWLSTGPAPIRITFEQSTGNLIPINCNVAYPGTAQYSTYAAQIGNNGSIVNGADNTNNTATEAYMIKPHQFTNSGNTYLTYWLVDQMASPTGTLSGVAATAYTSNGQTRWATTAQRTMVTYQVSDANTAFLTYHSSYTFPTYADMPKNFMPINANNTLCAVVSSAKTSFLAWNNNSGWASSGVYNQEFRMLGMDSTNRIWGYAMDKDQGSIHVVTPSLSVNVSVRMAATNYTYSGTTINTTATINAFDYTGTRIAANVSLTIDGSTMTFTDNGLKTLNVLTSVGGDTTVNLSIYGGGVNNIYAYA